MRDGSWKHPERSVSFGRPSLWRVCMEYRFDFDDQLPDLPMAFDFEEVAELLERKVFVPNSSQEPVGRVHVKKLQDVKYRPSERFILSP